MLGCYLLLRRNDTHTPTPSKHYPIISRRDGQKKIISRREPVLVSKRTGHLLRRGEMSASLRTNLPVTNVRDQIYVSAVPLRASKGPGQLLMSSAYSFNLWSMQHFMVIIKHSSPAQSQVISESWNFYGEKSGFWVTIFTFATIQIPPMSSLTP